MPSVRSEHGPNGAEHRPVGAVAGPAAGPAPVVAPAPRQSSRRPRGPRSPRLAVWLGVLAVALLVLTPLAGLGRADRLGAQTEITCDDFTRQAAAQALLDADESYAETLDPDGDGVACNTPDPTPTSAATATPTAAPTATATATEATEETDSTGRNPLRGRFGSNRQDFENAHGLATGPSEAYPVGYPYAVDGVERATVFYHRGYVAYITLVAPEDEPWEQAEAQEIAANLLPADWEQSGTPIRTEEGDLLIPGHSPYMETRFSPATYERYGASGEPGDVYMLFRLDAEGGVTAVELGLGNAVQTWDLEEDEEATEEVEPTPTLDPVVAAEAEAFLRDMRRQFDVLVASIDEFGQIISDPNFTTDQALFDRLVEILVLWSGAATNAETLDPPNILEPLHETFLEYTTLLSGASIDLTLGLSSGDQASIQAGGEKLEQAIGLQDEIEQALTEAGV